MSDENSFRLVKVNESIPEGFVPFRGLVPSKIFYRMLSAGHFPVGIPAPLTTQSYYVKEGIIFHDLNHLSAMINDPKYMAQVRAAAKSMVEFEEAPNDDSRARFNRYEFFVEFFNSISPDRKEKVINLIAEIKVALSASQISISSFGGKEASWKYLNDITNRLVQARPEVFSKIDTLFALTQTANFWTSLGGAIRPIEFRYGTVEALLKIQGDSSLMMYDRPDLKWKVFLANPERWAQDNHLRMQARAAFLLGMENVAQLDRSAIFDALFSNSENFSSELERLCRLGVLKYPFLCR